MSRRAHIKRAKILRGRDECTVSSNMGVFSGPIPRDATPDLRKSLEKEIRLAQALRGYYQD